MKKPRVTISDLARSLDLSLCTVSKILNRSFDGFTYAPKTIARVDATAKRLGYRPNRQAQSLRTRKSHLVGFVLPTAQIALFGSLTDRLELELRNRGFQVLIAHTRNDPVAEAELIPELLGRGIDGMVWIPATSRPDLKRVGLRGDFPTVILDRSGCIPDMPFVATANRTAARDLAQRVYDAGHRRAGVINAPANDRSMRERLRGIQDVFGGELQVRNAANDPEAGRDAAVALLGKGPKLSMLFALSEPLAVGALAGLRDLGLRIPEDLSFASFDDFPLASHWSPPLTVVRQDISALAIATAELLLKRIALPAESFDPVRVGASVVWRDSVAAR